MTEKIYDKNVYCCESYSNIIKIIEKDDDILLVLDKTPFFPEGGGQLSDKGFIDDAEVSYVFEKNNVIYHKVNHKPSGTNVKCLIDWNTRLDHMQQHCGEHILSGVFLKLFNGHNKGFHMGEDYVTIDIDTPQITNEMIELVENKANKLFPKI